MKTKVLHYVFQTVLIDEDDNGELGEPIPLQPITLRGKTGLKTLLPQHLKDVEALIVEREKELNAPKPNRAARRAKPK